MMTTAQLGNYDNTGARLFVLETISRQMAVYAIQPQTTSAGSAPKFELLEKINFAGQSAAPAR